MTAAQGTDAGPKATIPVAIITGFLGSGKTTVLNHIVQQPGMRSTAVIINEFGEIGIDHLLVETSSEMMMELNNGCICCTIRGDLADKLGSLAMWLDVGRIPPVERVVVETTGLADPAPIMHTLMVEQDLLSRYRLDRVITVVDAIAGAAALDRFPEATKQVAIADVLLLAKTDLMAAHSDVAPYVELLARLRALNPRAPVHETVGGVVDPQRIFGPRDGGVDADFATLAAAATGDAAAEHPAGVPASGDRGTGAQQHDYRSAGIGSFVVELRNPVDAGRFDALLRELAADFGRQLLRTKGIVHVAGVPERPAVVHGVQHVFFPVSWLERWPDGERSTRLVFITQGLAPKVIRERFREHFS